MDIKKVVQLTNEQYEELLKNGQVEVNGEIKTKEDGAIYVCPASESWAELNNKIDEALVRPNRVVHNPYSVEELETIIARLREQYNETDSVVGFRCTMKQGQILRVSPTYTMYLNETLRESDYICENESEMISIVLFGTENHNMNITRDLIDFRYNIETYVEMKIASVAIETGFYTTTNLLTLYGITVSQSIYCQEYRGDRLTTYTSSNAPTIMPAVKKIYFTGNSIGSALAFNNIFLEEANFDTVTNLYANYQRQPFSGTTNPNLILSFPNLLNITTSNAYPNINSAIFNGVAHLIIGEKCRSLASILLGGACGIVELYCKDAVNNMVNGLLGFSASVNYLYLCPEWNCGMSLAQVGGITKENMIEIFNNLKDLTGETSKKLTINSSLYALLDEEDLLIAIRKNWTIAY